MPLLTETEHIMTEEELKVKFDYPIIYFNVLILILSIYILFQWGNLLGFPIFYARFQVNQNVSSVKLCF